MSTDSSGAAQAQSVQDEVRQQAGKLLTQFAGYVGFETINMGLKNGLLAALAESEAGLTSAELAAAAGTDRFYTEVWTRAACRGRPSFTWLIQ